MVVPMSNIIFFHSRDAEEEVTQEEEFPKKLQEKLAVFKDIYPNNIVSVDGKRAFCGPTGSLSFEIQATPILKILGMSYQLLIARQRQAKQGVILDG